MMERQMLYEDPVFAHLRAAVDALAQVQTAPPAQVSGEAETATRAVTSARDILIRRLRESGASGDAARERLLLDEINAILSRVFAIQFPVAGVNRQEIKETRGEIERILRVHESTRTP